jgi:type VI secretion system protein ImpH
MGAAVGRETDALAFLAEMAETPYRFDFYQALRRLECLYADEPRWGMAPRPANEPVRLGQAPDMTFAPAAISAVDLGQPPRVTVCVTGLLGPNGPLPSHLTEFAHERLLHAGDRTFVRFLDLFNHRFLLLFYRAWAQAQPHVSHDRPAKDRFAAHVAALLGLDDDDRHVRDSLPSGAKLFYAGILARQVRDADGLASILRDFFEAPVEIEQHVSHWMDMDPGQSTRLGHAAAVLGTEAALGDRVPDCQHRFRIAIGPLTWERYCAFLPGGNALRQLTDWVRFYLSFELAWDMRLILTGDSVPDLTLGTGARLGWTSWLGAHTPGDADDLCLDAEVFLDRSGDYAA